MEANSNLLFDETPALPQTGAGRKISVELNYTDRVNFAAQQNLISIFQELVVSNDSDEKLEDLRVVIKSTPDLFEPINIRIDRIEPQTRLRVEKFSEKPNAALLGRLSERVQGEIELEIFDVEPTIEGAKPLFSERYPTTIFPWNEWTGNSVFPGLLAAFVTPNAPGVARLASETCEILKSKKRKESLEGYQSEDKERVYEIVQAVYEAVLRQGIRYANPPASFESQGQRIRFVDQILREKFATCLDLSALFAGVLEYCGLNPIIFLTKGHAFVGAHLFDETFSESCVDSEDLQAIRKRVDLDQIVVFETTVVVNDSRASFKEAEIIGRSKLEDEALFESALDVRRARFENIRPIPLTRKEGDDQDVALDLSNAKSLPRVESAPRALAKEVEAAENSTPKTRVDKWKQNLLDLSLRNRLLNFTEKSAFTFLFPESKLAELEDALGAGGSFHIVPSTPEIDKKADETSRASNYRNLARFSEERLVREFKSKKLLVRPGVDQSETNKRLTKLSRDASTSASESGVNSLFLAFGTAERYDKKLDKKFRAPLLLIPVKLTGSAAKNDFCLTRADEDATLNTTLLEYLRVDFGREIRGLDPNDLPTDDVGVDVERILQIFRQETRDFPDWELKNELSLGLFSFQKYVMWSDLDVHVDDLMENPIVRHLVETPQKAYSDGIPLVEAERTDADYTFSDVVTPLSADSSQLAAILTAEKGKSFVLQGPPGTGKSQTIANIIAYCLYRGQRVLFVAEKRAALEVVYRRLCNLGLGAFCLELHSNKSGKRQILDQLNESLQVCAQAANSDWDSVTRELETLKEALNEYVDELHRKRPNGLTLYRALGWLASRESFKTLADSLKKDSNESFANVSAARFEALLKLGEELRDAASNLPESVWEDLRGVTLDEWSLKSSREINELARTVQRNGVALRGQTRQFAASSGVKDELETVVDVQNVWKLGRTLENVDFTIPSGFYSSDWDATAPKFRQYVDLERNVEKRLAELYRNGWSALQKSRETGAALRRGTSNDFEIGELNSEISDVCASLDNEDTSARQSRLDFAVAGAEFHAAAQKMLSRVGLQDARGERTVWRLGELIKKLTNANSPGQGFLLDDWDGFFNRTKRYADAVRARFAASLEIDPFDYVSALNLDFSTAESERLPQGLFDVARVCDSIVLSDDANALTRGYAALLKEASALNAASTKAFGEIGVKDEINEKNVSTYRPVFKALTELPPRSKFFLSDDWAIVAPRLKRSVEIGKKYAETRAALDEFDLNVVLNFDATSAKREPGTIPRGVFAFADVRKRRELDMSTFDGFSLDDAQSEFETKAAPSANDDSAALDDFSRKITRLIRATRRILEELEIETPVDETSALAIYRLTSPMRELDAPTETFLSDDWNEFSRDARAALDARFQNKLARCVLAEFDLDKTASFDVGAAREKFARVSRSFFLFRNSKKRAFVAEIKALATNGESASFKFDDAPKIFDAIESYVATKREIERLEPLCGERLGADRNEAANRQNLERRLELGDQIVKAFSESSFGADVKAKALGRFWFASARVSSPERAALQEFGDAWESCAQSVAKFAERVERIQSDLTEFDKESKKDGGLCQERFGEDWQGVDSDWATLLAYVESGERVANAVRKLFANEERVAVFLRAFGKIWTREKIENGALGTTLREFCDGWNRCVAKLREFAPQFNAWKEDYRKQEETIRLETPGIGARFTPDVDPSDWERVAETGDEIVKQVGRLFQGPATRETFLKRIDELWFSFSTGRSADVALVDNFLRCWKRYEETAESFFRSLDELPPETDEFNVASETNGAQKIDLTNLAASLAEYVCAYSKLKRCEAETDAFSSMMKTDGKYEPDSANHILETVERTDAAAKALCAESSLLNVKTLADVREKIGAILADVSNENGVKELSAQAQRLENDFQRLRELSRNLKDLLKFDVKFEDATLADADLELANRVLRAQNELGVWSKWNQIKASAIDEFPKLVAAIERRETEISQIADVVRYVLYSQFANDVVDSTRALGDFVRQPDKRENMIERFRSLDKEYAELSRRLVVAKLAKSLAPIQRNEDAPRETELGALRREINAKRHRKSVRMILGDIPTLLPRLKPCLLTSPLSVAQYFPSDGEKYDLVVFDEASQIPVWDAVGAIARGKRLIVVGDSKQLPPTSFFQRTSFDDEDELSAFTEPESVLDECVDAQLPEIQLRWHYRSRREGLIAFSNQRYYGDRLYTFPSVDRENTGVRLVYVENGRYDRGGSKTNPIEAQTLVDAVIRRLSDPSFSDKSLGIVTFNEAQKNVIEDLLDAERRKRPEIEPFFDAERDEPVFVKNLENVQGDERDVMYFSICYGPDARGVVSSNFGPINKAGGERRLNVAITRAREENVVFSSIRARDLKLTNSSAERSGVRDLKDFLDYAESGGRRMTESTSDASEHDYDSSFEEEVAKFLRSKGYEVKTQVGCSKYRIDLAIVAPDESNEYVVGIECDGAAYHSSASARDRDFLRQSVLEGLGWRVVRVWSTRWFYDRAKAEEKLSNEIDDAFKAWKEDRRLKQTTRPGENTNRGSKDESERKPCFASAETREPSARGLYGAETERAAVAKNRDEYERDYPSLSYLNEKTFQNDGDFYDWRATSLIKRQIRRIVEVEGPITEELLLERIKTVWNVSRAGNPFKLTFASCLQNVLQTRQSDGKRVFWNSQTVPSTYRLYRTGGNRKFSEIPLQEFFNALERVKAECGEYADEDVLYRETLRRFDIQRLTQQMKAAINQEKDNR